MGAACEDPGADLGLFLHVQGWGPGECPRARGTPQQHVPRCGNARPRHSFSSGGPSQKCLKKFFRELVSYQNLSFV